ncbi:MAG: hypothetical protein JWN30_1596, partial [Bacilli bacterium]|nr:hypothetical protein [Bacilli bacterium]
GSGKPQQVGGTAHVTDDYVPVGATSLHVDSTAGLTVGDHIIVQCPIEQNWIQAIGMDKIPPRPGAKTGTHWSPGAGLQFDRTITAIQGNQLTLDVPLTNALEKNYTHATVWKYDFPGRISQSGVEDLATDGNAFTQNADYKPSGFFNSQFIVMSNVQDGWMSNVVSHNFGQPFVVGSGAIRVTITDCSALEMAVPQDISDQPAAFTVSGQLTLVVNCKATGSNYHAWVTQGAVPGPNVFSHDSAVNTGARKLDGGPHQRWATGILFEDITMSSDGNLELMDRSWMGTGQGYAGANSVLWNCSVGTYRVDNPPTAHNWAFGLKGKQQTDASHQKGEEMSLDQFVQPESLYDQQLSERLHQ